MADISLATAVAQAPYLNSLSRGVYALVGCDIDPLALKAAQDASSRAATVPRQAPASGLAPSFELLVTEPNLRNEQYIMPKHVLQRVGPGVKTVFGSKQQIRVAPRGLIRGINAYFNGELEHGDRIAVELRSPALLLLRRIGQQAD